MRARNESGFALLLIFLMAAIIGITLYMEIPRVAFDTQRQKELLLIERGEQYKRAIQLFVRKNSRYPSRIEELESFNNQRFLRHKYKDPITGKEEWRLIKAGPGGVLIDSLVNQPKDQKASSATPQNFIAELQQVGGSGATGQQGVNPALRRRASEGGTPGGTVLGPDGQPVQPQPVQPQPGVAGIAGLPGQPQLPGQSGIPPQFPVGQPAVIGNLPGQQPTLPGQAINPSQIPGQFPPGQTGAVPGMPGQTYPGQVYPGQPYPGQTYPGQTYPGQTYPAQTFPGQTYPGQTYPGQQPTIPGLPGTRPGQTTSSGTPYIGGSQPYIGGGTYIGGQPATTQPGAVQYPGMPGAPVNSQTGGVSPRPYSTVPGAQGSSPAFPQPGMTTGSNQATDLIRQLLTTPRPGGVPSGAAGIAGMNIGPGIAGIASTSENEGILVYNERTKYNEWEFIYDPTKEKRVANPSAGAIGTPADRMSGQSGTGTGVGGAGSSFGNTGAGSSSGSGFGGQTSGFGGSGFGQQGSSQPTGGIGRRP